MQLSIISKCAAVTLSSKLQPASNIYYIDGIAIPCRDFYVDLGMAVSCGLSFDQHIHSIVSQARQRVGTSFRGFLSRNLSTMRLAFITYNRPILKCNSIAWNPNFVYLIDLIENVQRHFLLNASLHYRHYLTPKD
jgi:hypothetical protein